MRRTRMYRLTVGLLGADALCPTLHLYAVSCQDGNWKKSLGPHPWYSLYRAWFSHCETYVSACPDRSVLHRIYALQIPLSTWHRKVIALAPLI